MPFQPPSSLLDGKYGLTVKPDPSDWLAIEIGDTKQPSAFYPQAKVMRWNNDVNLSFRLVDSAPALPATVVQDGNVVKWQKRSIEAHFYDRGDSPDHPEGAFELEVLLKERPASNVVGFTLQTKGLDFFYQPILTQAEIDDGCSRPENVVGSYAVYHSTQKGDYSKLGGNNYRAGKVCHIYRPQVSDANGASTWADLNIDAVALTATIIIPQAFLDTAVYPVLVDPTFGWTTGGASNQSGNSGYAYTSGDTASPSSSGALQSMSAYVWEGSGSVRVSLAVYNGVTLVDYTDQYTISVSNGSPPQWYQGIVVNKASVSQGIGYYLAWKAENYSLQMMYDTVGTNYVMWHVDAYYDPWGNPEYFTQWGSAYRHPAVSPISRTRPGATR